MGKKSSKLFERIFISLIIGTISFNTVGQDNFSEEYNESKYISKNILENKYNRAIVRDTTFMDLIVSKIDEYQNDESVRAKIINTYYNRILGGIITDYSEYMMNHTHKYVDITIREHNNYFDDSFNDSVFNQGLNKDILNKQILDVTVALGDLTPFVKYYTVYLNKPYFFFNKFIIKPLSGEYYSIEEKLSGYPRLYDSVFLFYIYCDGKLYLDPCENRWLSSYE